MDIAAPTNHVLAAPEFQKPAFHVVVAVLNVFDHGSKRNAIGGEFVGVHLHLVLLHKTADRGHFGDSGHTRQPVTKLPVLKAAQLGQVVLAGLVHQCILKDPTHSGSVRTERGIDTVGELSANSLEVFKNPRPRPVKVRAVFENDVHVRVAEIRESPDSPHPRG